MDSLTHGLLGLAIASVRRPDRDSAAVWVACLVAAELPDLDYLLPASDPVLHSLRAHRGFSHSLVAAPLVALAAAAIAKLFFRTASWRSLFPWSLLAVVFGHLLADAWTGWGTRLLLPFSDARVTLDWMMVVDPLFTAPLLIAALWGLRRRVLVRNSLLLGLAIAVLYLGSRVALKELLTRRVTSRYPTATGVAVFPSWLGPFSWRYVATLPEQYAAGRVTALRPPEEQALHRRVPDDPIGAAARANETVREALAWARFPLAPEERTARGTLVRIADLRYHLNGDPTLRFEVLLDPGGRVLETRLDRGGSARALLERFRAPSSR